MNRMQRGMQKGFTAMAGVEASTPFLSRRRPRSAAAFSRAAAQFRSSKSTGGEGEGGSGTWGGTGRHAAKQRGANRSKTRTRFGIAGFSALTAAAAAYAVAEGDMEDLNKLYPELQSVLKNIPSVESNQIMKELGSSSYEVLYKVTRLNTVAASEALEFNSHARHQGQLTQQIDIFNGAEEIKKRYELGKIIGEGSFASVRIAKDKKTGLKVAVKEVNKSLSDQLALNNEVQVLKKIGKHDNIISFIDVYDSKDILYIITDLADSGELFDHIIAAGELSEQSASKMMMEAMLATKHLHDHHIIHLDIKPENLLLARSQSSSETIKKDAKKSSGGNDLHIKLADFGLAINLSEADCHSVITESVGTPAYWAPEIVKNEPFGKAVDIWALGCVLYILLCGSHPFDPFGDAAEAEILSRVIQGNYDRENSQYLQVSPEGKDLLFHMLDPNPETRYDAKQVLRHPWLSDSEQLLSSQSMPLSYILKLKAFQVLRLMRIGLDAHSSCKTNDVEGCFKMFSSFDENNDGVLSRQELATALKKMGVSFNNQEMDEMMNLFDTEKDGTISQDEFKNAVLEKRSQFVPDTKDRLKQIKMLFDVFDKDKDGYIENEDCVHLMNQLGNLDNKSKLFRKLQHFKTKRRKDVNKIDFAEFVRYYRELEMQRDQTEKGMFRGGTLHQKRRQTTTRTVTAKSKSGGKVNTFIPGETQSNSKQREPDQLAASA